MAFCQVADLANYDTIKRSLRKEKVIRSMALIDIADIKQEMSSMAKRLADIRGSL